MCVVNSLHAGAIPSKTERNFKPKILEIFDINKPAYYLLTSPYICTGWLIHMHLSS